MAVHYLQMLSPADLEPASRPVEGLTLCEVVPSGALSRRFYLDVGGDWNWSDRARWSPRRWERYVQENPIATVVLAWHREEAGYGEMLNRDGDIEIANFGLLKEYIGRGLGAAALFQVVRFAWSLSKAQRVWLHTCDNDHPNALHNYKRRGFEHYRSED